MTIDVNLIREFVNLGLQATDLSEVGRLKAIERQLEDSIDWLKDRAKAESDVDKKSQLLKEVTAAERELMTVQNKITKLETTNE